MNRLLAALVLSAASLSGSGVYAQSLGVAPVESIVAIVEEDVILRSELDRAVANIRNQYAGSQQQLPPNDVLERQVLDRLVLLRLQLGRAIAAGVRISDSEVDQTVQNIARQNNITEAQLRAQLQRDGLPYDEFRQTLRDELTAQRLRQNITQSRVNVSDTEIDILLASNSLKRGEVRTSHLLVAIPEGATQEQLETARKKIEGIQQLISRGELDFKAAAIRYSDAPNALDGGDLGWRSFDEVPSMFANLLAGMAKGDVSQPIRGPSGYHLMQVTDKRERSAETVTEYHMRGIMVRTTEIITSEQALAKANQIHQRLMAGEDFAAVAKEVSDDTMTRNQGGDMGWFPPMAWGTAVGNQLLALKDGETSKPFSSEAGYHILQRLGSRVQDVTVESERNRARETIAKRKSEEEFERFIRQMRDESFVETRLKS
ncbi:MAG: peptidylprolyl isomerase [Pseudomarimonas sp.]